MRIGFSVLAIVLPAIGCSSSESVRPVVTSVEHNADTALPLRLCTGSGTAAFASAPSQLVVSGSNFLPGVELTADNPAPKYPFVELRGAAGTIVASTQYEGAQQLRAFIPDFDFATGQATAYGAFDLAVVDPDGNDAVVPHAVDHVPPPRVDSARPSTICQDRNETVVLSGANFTPGPAIVSLDVGQGGFAATATSTTVTATIAAGSIFQFANSVGLIVQDSDGCLTTFRVAVAQGCGP